MLNIYFAVFLKKDMSKTLKRVVSRPEIFDASVYLYLDLRYIKSFVSFYIVVYYLWNRERKVLIIGRAIFWNKYICVVFYSRYSDIS